ncbi:CorA metal ion transporter, partial [Linderina macrospora]
SIDRVRMLTGVCPMYVVYAVMDSVTDALMADMRAVELEVDKVDEVVLVLSQSEKADVLQRTGLVRRRILGLWRLATGKPEVVKAVLRATVRLPPTAFTADAEHLLGDVLDHLWALVSACAHCEMVLSRAHSNYMGQISLELGDASVGTTMFSSQWLVITAILLPVQFVTGLFGMNVPVPFQGDQPGHDNLNAWMTIMACCVGFVVVFGGWAKWKKIF